MVNAKIKDTNLSVKPQVYQEEVAELMFQSSMPNYEQPKQGTVLN